ncbi:hypothetical protein O7627_31395 [Solwaraspora sp. WMMD1047]|uniref:hypothetical protein n=1 Tax=Solwaraspora sp. WMMD1047 TaxID=3016102 RepID=UPI0024165BF0|nr:hypothetical protein [Solwaraspora sp. WMMD1047]MDG4833785.1 hypothetical protein [Solwaraspora sp. WMMD1047]
MRALSKEQFTAYANGQIEMADQILAGHRQGPGGWCSCGKQLPCTVEEHATATRNRYRNKLALLDSTTALPVLACAAPPRRNPLWRRLLAGLR